MIIVKVQTIEERHAVIDRTQERGHYALVSAAGILIIELKELAVSMFGTIASRFAGGDEEPIAIMSVLDDRRLPCIGFAVDTPACVLMYGVPDGEVTQLLRDADVGRVDAIKEEGHHKSMAN